MTPQNTTLQLAIQSIRAGRKIEARQQLARVLKDDPNCEQAWLWMSAVVDTDAERIKCLQRVLAINPNNVAAQRGLAQLQAVVSQTMQDVVIQKNPEPRIPPADSFSSEATTTIVCQACDFENLLEADFCEACGRKLKPQNAPPQRDFIKEIATSPTIQKFVSKLPKDRRIWVAIGAGLVMWAVLFLCTVSGMNAGRKLLRSISQPVANVPAPGIAATSTSETVKRSNEPRWAIWGIPNYELRDIVMISSNEGWMVGKTGRIWHYHKGIWEANDDLVSTTNGFEAIDAIESGELWSISGKSIYHYRRGKWVAEATEVDSWSLFDLDMVSKSDGWATGADGTILHYNKGSWNAVESPSSQHLNAIAMLDANEGWALGTSGTILHYIDEQWQKFNSPTREHLRSIAMLDNTEGWAVGQECTILHYIDQNWHVVPCPLDNPEDLHAIAMLNSGEGWAVGDDGIILHFQYGEWQEVESHISDSTTLYSITMLNENEGWAIGEDGALLHYQNGWWEVLSGPRSENLTTVEVVNNNDIWIGGAEGTMLHYQRGVMHLAPIFTDLLDARRAGRAEKLSFSTSGEGWATGGYGRLMIILLHYKDNNWVQSDSSFLIVGDSNWVNLYDIDMISLEEGWAVGEVAHNRSNAAFAHFTEGYWNLVMTDMTGGFLSIDMINAQEGWAVGNYGHIAHYQDGIWTEFSSPTSDDLYALEMQNANEGWAVGGNGIILHYQQGIWEIFDTPTSLSLWDIDVIGRNDLWITGNEGKIFHYARGEWEEFETPTDQQLFAIAMVNDKEGWAVGKDGILLHFTTDAEEMFNVRW